MFSYHLIASQKKLISFKIIIVSKRIDKGNIFLNSGLNIISDVLMMKVTAVVNGCWNAFIDFTPRPNMLLHAIMLHFILCNLTLIFCIFYE